MLQPRPRALSALGFHLGTPARALAVALSGVGLAWLWFHGRWWIALIAGIAGCCAGITLDGAGRRLVVKRPVLATGLMEWWIVTPAMIAALASGVVAVITVLLAVPDTAPQDTKTLIGALTTGLTGFVSASFISWAGDEKDSRIGDHIRDAFRAVFKRVPEPPAPPPAGIHYFAPDSAGERWVYSDEYRGVEGWGREARRRRAAGVAEELLSGASDP